MIDSKKPGCLSYILIAGLALSFIGCTNDRPNRNGDVFHVTEASSVVGPIVHDPLMYPTKAPHFCWPKSEKCFTDGYTVPTNAKGKVDILFVVQTSDSIAPQRAKIISEIQSFVQTLPPSADFNIAVMLSHGSTSSLSGRLYRVDSEPMVLKSTELNSNEIQYYLAEKLLRVVTDGPSGGGEEGMFSLFNGITTSTWLAESQSYGFFRSDASLGVVFIADRRDICAMTPTGVPAEVDPLKIEARIRDCEGLTAAGLTSRLSLLKRQQAVQVSGIIYTQTPTPPGKEIGYGIVDMIARNPGYAIDIQYNDISDGLRSIAELAGGDSTAQTQFVLTHGHVKPDTVKVLVNGQPAPYTLEGNVVTLASPAFGGAQVQVDYCVKRKYFRKSK